MWVNGNNVSTQLQQHFVSSGYITLTKNNISQLSYGILDQLKMSFGRDDVERVERLGTHLQKLRQDTKEVADALLVISREFHIVYLDSKKATIKGSTAGVVGGTLAAIGFGLSFVTFGASIGLTVVGALIGAAGGMVTGHASIKESVKSKRAVKEAEQLIERFENTRNIILTECKEISDKLQIDGLDTVFQHWMSFFSKLVGGSVKIGWSVVYKTIYNTVSNIKLGRAASQFTIESLSSTTGRVTAASLKATSVVARGFHIAGGVMGIVLIPVDIGFLVHSARAVAADKLPDTYKKITEVAE
ncbi:uncharacterized protein LOC127847175 [Dreissena polymorpha]|uniref:Uncharacterized protein n=1 Tax=Dreissena polymorpha TaxID=45954 RepID=A0A9D4DDI5_DREPO|nr:uncharacterized protein LOC127847175 [Dreissena polymorpha]KAH3747662.1 hypothetical protein DPMN_182091 [Dreissena polymorpha]